MRVIALLLLLAAGPASAQTGFPVVTHYPQRGGITPDTTRASIPAYEFYSAARSDEYAPTRQDFDTAVQLMFQATNIQVRVVNDPSELMEGATQIQLVNNWPIGAALYTVAVPAGWRRINSYPILLSGNPTGYSNNFRVYRAGEGGILAFAALRGFVAAFSNAGGIESQGASDNVLRSVGEAIATFVTLGGDKQRVVTAGFSRGASTAFVWAANPLDLDYNVIAAFGHSLPTDTLDAVLAPYATYPMLGWLADTVTNDVRTSRYSNAPPPHTLPNRILQILTGQGTMNLKSASSMIERLRGKQLVYSVSTHDAVVPYKTGVAFTRGLALAGIPAMSVLVQNGAHGWSGDVVAELSRAIEVIGAGMAYTAPPGRVYSVQGDTVNHDYQRQTRVSRQTMPFSVVLPYRASPGQPMRIDVCGAPGASYVLCAVLDGTAQTSAVHVSGNIPGDECVSHSVSAPLVQGLYPWLAELNGSPMPRNLTAIRTHSAELQVGNIQPGNFEALVGQVWVAEGLSELSPHAPEVGQPCPPSANAPVYDGGFEDTGFLTNLPDATTPRDATTGTVIDAGVVDTGNRKPPDPTCGCTTAQSDPDPSVLAFAMLVVLAVRRSRR